jgi:hypothetical protein
VHSGAKFAMILQDSQDKGVLRRIDGHGAYELESKNPTQNWFLTHRVDGEIKPFSIACYEKSNEVAEEEVGGDKKGVLSLKIKDHIFFHAGNSYSIGAAIPSGTSPGDFSFKMKSIVRLVNFPFSVLESVDGETKHQLKRHRGVAVGEIYGLGADGFHVKLYGDELSDIGLPLAASAYLLYTTR